MIYFIPTLGICSSTVRRWRAMIIRGHFLSSYYSCNNNTDWQWSLFYMYTKLAMESAPDSYSEYRLLWFSFKIILFYLALFFFNQSLLSVLFLNLWLMTKEPVIRPALGSMLANWDVLDFLLSRSCSNPGRAPKDISIKKKSV